MNGFDRPFWTPLMVLAWVRTGTADVVSEAARLWDDPGSYAEDTHKPIYETRWTSERGPHHPAHIEILNREDHPAGVVYERPAERPDHTWLDLHILYSDKGVVAIRSYAEADEAILKSLQTGRLTARGLAAGVGTHQRIGDMDWLSLRLDYREQSTRGGAWQDLLIPKAEVLECWCAPVESVADRSQDEIRTGGQGNQRGPWFISLVKWVANATAEQVEEIDGSPNRDELVRRVARICRDAGNEMPRRDPTNVKRSWEAAKKNAGIE